MAVENETQTREIYGAELEEGATELAESLAGTQIVDCSRDVSKILPVLCSIAISLKKLAEETNAVTANMRFDK